MNDDKPNYFAIIPADVRYDNSLKPMEKIIYAEISALLNKRGYCFATNGYFAKLYDCDKTTVSKWLSNLQNKGYIKIVLVRDSKNAVVERKIYCTNIPKDIPEDLPIGENADTPIEKNANTPIGENAKYTNTREYQYKGITNLKNCATHHSQEFPTPLDVHKFYLEHELVSLPYDFFNYQQKKHWKLPDGEEVKNWKKIYILFDANNPDGFARHKPDLAFDISDYNTQSFDKRSLSA